MFIVRVDHLSDEQLVFFGWQREHEGDEFSVYRHMREGTDAIVSNLPPRYLPVDDVNDAQQMSRGKIILGPPPRH
jgi:hypothetical protein